MANNGIGSALQRKRAREEKEARDEEEMDIIILTVGLIIVLIPCIRHKGINRLGGSAQKRSRADQLSTAVECLTATLEMYFKTKRQRDGLKVEELHEFVQNASGLSRVEQFDAVERLSHIDPGQFQILKTYNDDRKKAWIQWFISRPTTS